MQQRIARLRTYARRLKAEIDALYLACRHPGVPWYAKAVAVCVVAYAFSPIDLIPDFVPILGYLDDLILVPAGIALAIRLIPPEIMAACRQTAQERQRQNKPTNWIAAVVIVALWLVLATLAVMLVVR